MHRGVSNCGIAASAQAAARMPPRCCQLPALFSRPLPATVHRCEMHLRSCCFARWLTKRGKSNFSGGEFYSQLPPSQLTTKDMGANLGRQLGSSLSNNFPRWTPQANESPQYFGQSLKVHLHRLFPNIRSFRTRHFSCPTPQQPVSEPVFPAFPNTAVRAVVPQML